MLMRSLVLSLILTIVVNMLFLTDTMIPNRRLELGAILLYF